MKIYKILPCQNNHLENEEKPEMYNWKPHANHKNKLIECVKEIIKTPLKNLRKKWTYIVWSQKDTML